MEACFTISPGTEEEFWQAQERMGPVAASQPGFQGVIGGPIANSAWLYFCGKFESPDLMDQWQHSKQHRPVQDMAHKKWFDAYYIRKWRLPAAGEAVEGRTFCETALARDVPLADDELRSVIASINESVERHTPLRFETLTGQYEQQPYQLVGPLEEFPQLAPTRYLLLTHWDRVDDLRAWLESPVTTALKDIADVDTQIHVPVYQDPATRNGVRADGLQREWSRHPAADTEPR